MDRQIIYPGQIPLETDLLNAQKNTLIGLAKLAAAIFGTTTQVNGLACTPTSPVSLQVDVAAGEIYQLANIDGTPYSSLSADTTHQILKQGIALDKSTLSCPAPGTAGFSINYLIQATYQDVDGAPVVLPYYNASNPAVAYSGPANAGTTNNTVRQGKVTLSVKAGTAATTGTQTTPSADSGYVGLYVVTVANGQTTITNSNISTYSGAPFIGVLLNQAAADARYAKLAGSASQAFSTAALTASGIITSMVGNNSGVLNSASATTGWQYMRLANTSGGVVVGVEGSSAGGLIVGDTPYDACFYGVSGISWSANNGAALHMRLSNTGNLTTSANATFGNGAATTLVRANGTNSGTGGGGVIGVQNGGADVIFIGNKGALLGTAYDATPMLYGASAISTNVGMNIGGKVNATTAASASGDCALYQQVPGLGQTWQSVTRNSGTVYTNSTSAEQKFIINCAVSSVASTTLTIDGVTFNVMAVDAAIATIGNTVGYFSVQPGKSYTLTDTGSITSRSTYMCSQ